MVALTSGDLFIIFSFSFLFVYVALAIYSFLSRKEKETQSRKENDYRGQVIFGLDGFSILQTNVQFYSCVYGLNNNREVSRINLAPERNVYSNQPSGVIQTQEYKENFVL